MRKVILTFFLILTVNAGVIVSAMEESGAGYKNPQILIYGLDGADWDIMLPMMLQGELPEMSDVMKSGTAANMESLRILISPRIWTTIATGKGPRFHNVMDWTVKGEDGEMLPVNSEFRTTKALWNMFSDMNRSTGFIGWLATWPAEPVKGFMVSSYLPRGLAPEVDVPLKGRLEVSVPKAAYPENLSVRLADYIVTPDDTASEIRRKALPPEFEEKGEKYAAEAVGAIEKSLAIDESFVNAAKYLYSKYSPDLNAVYIASVDVASHRFYKFFIPDIRKPAEPKDVKIFGDVLPWVYRKSDYFLKQCRDVLDPDISVVLSDHGFRPYRTKEKPHISGWHRSRSVLMAAGQGIMQRSTMVHARALDFTPTLLYAAGLPVSRDMKGRVIEEFFKPEELAARSIEYLDFFSYDEIDMDEDSRFQPHARTGGRSFGRTDADEDLMEQLEELGYID